jgi:hypothetical protein
MQRHKRGGRMKITYYELLTKMLNGEPVKKVKYFNCIYTFNGESYINSAGEYIMPLDIDAISVKNIEIIEEPKEELEEIELIDIHYVDDKCIFKVNGQSIDETIAIKVNELIANQNKIVRELKANK